VGVADYFATWQAMKDFTAFRTDSTCDEIWLVEHPPVYTQGVACKPEHLLYNNGIPVIRTDRGGQITYHAPGQIIAYLLLDMRRLKLGVRELVRKMEGSVVDLLQDYCIRAEGRTDAPGVYVNGEKIAALGLKIKNGCCYHGLALNVDMDLTPFAAINPCGYPGLRVTQTKDLGIADGLDSLSAKLCEKLKARLLSAPSRIAEHS
jgi:lipoyl(octanoyl) transferase